MVLFGKKTALISVFVFYEFVSETGGQVQISGRSNLTQCCQRLATAATFLRKELCCPEVQ